MTDFVSAIQAAKQQLEAETSRRPPKLARPQTAEFYHRPAPQSNGASNGVPYQKSKSFHFGVHKESEPPVATLSFNSHKKFERSVSDITERNPYGGSASVGGGVGGVSIGGGGKHGDYVHPDFLHPAPAPNAGDDDTITSSLSGTLPDLPGAGRRTAPPALTKDHLRPLTEGAGANKTNLLPPLSEHETSMNASVPGNAAASVGSSRSGSKKTAAGGSGTGDAQKRIEEIMTAYQGKVDTILKKREGGGEGGSGGEGGKDIGALFDSAKRGDGAPGNDDSATAAVADANAAIAAPATAEATGQPRGDSKIDDIISSYQKRVGEIMGQTAALNEKDPTAAPGARGAPTSPAKSAPQSQLQAQWQVAEDDAPPTPPGGPGTLVPYLAVQNMIADDEESDGPETWSAAPSDRSRSPSRSRSPGSRGRGRSESPDGSRGDSGSRSGSRGSSGSRSRSPDRSRSGSPYSGSYSRSRSGSEGSYDSRTSNEEDDGRGEGGEEENGYPTFHKTAARTAVSGGVPVRQGSMSERANAILQSLNGGSSDAVDTDKGSNNNSNSAGQPSSYNRSGGSGDNDNDDDDEGSYSGDDDGYISGASSASEASPSRAYGYSNANAASPQDDDDEAEEDDDDEDRRRKSTALSDDAKESREDGGGYARKDSLARAQELTSSSSSSPNGKNKTTSEGERQRRQELERQLAAATQREADLRRESRRLEQTLADAQSRLDAVQTEARSRRYGASEQASRIAELERKLHHEKERSAELERERDATKEEYDQDLEEQKDINRQLEQMVMSEEFEKELEDEINQVKELERANRRYKVKVDMLEREKNAVAKKYDARIEEYTAKVGGLEERLLEWEKRAGALEAQNRETEEEWEAKVMDEQRRARELQFDLDKAQTKLHSLELEAAAVRESNGKIDEYEVVLGKLMERNEELEGEALAARDEAEMATRQAEVADRRRAVKTKDLEEKVEEQRVMIEQQQETLDESVKTILKLYSLNNERGDDFSVLSEEKLTDMARAIVPLGNTGGGRLPNNLDRLPPIRDDEDPNIALSPRRPARGIHSARGRELTQEVEHLRRSHSRGRSRSGADRERADAHPTAGTGAARSQSRGRGARTASIRQLAARAGRDRGPSEYDPTGPASDSRALAIVPASASVDECGGRYDAPPPMGRSASRGRAERGHRGPGDRERGSYRDAYGPEGAHAPRNRGPEHDAPGGRPYHHRERDRDRRDRDQDRDRDRDRGDPRRRPHRGQRDRDRRSDDRDRDRDRRDGGPLGDPYHRDNRSSQGGPGGPRREDPYRRQQSGHRGHGGGGGGYGDPRDRPSPRDPSVAGESIALDQWGGRPQGGGGRPRSRGRPRPSSRPAREP